MYDDEAEPLPQGVRALLAGLVFGFFAVLAVGAFFLSRHLATPSPEVREVVQAPAPIAPTPAPAPQPEPPVEKKGIGVTPFEPQTPPPAPPPVTPPERPAAPIALQLAGPVSGLYAGGGGKYLVFHLTEPRQLVIYDVAAKRTIGTIGGIDQNVRVAVGREKLFVGRWSDARIVRFDLRSGAQEQILAQKAQETLNHLAIGCDSDGPLVVGVNTANKQYEARLYDAETLAIIDAPIEPPTVPAREETPRAFPFAKGVGAAHIGVSTDGRAISLSDRLFTRTATGYKTVPINPSAWLRPNSDGSAALGSGLVNAEDGKWAKFEDREVRGFYPAANGPFFLSVEYGAGHPVRLMLHANQEPKPLGELPGSEQLTEHLRKSSVGVSSLSRNLTFLPEPGLVVFAAPGAHEVHLLPVDLPAMLAKAGRDVSFTSVAPAAVPKGRAYAYTATAIASDGTRPTLALESGPPGMTVTADGRLVWTPARDFPDASVDVRLVARTAAGKRAVQQFQLFLSK